MRRLTLALVTGAALGACAPEAPAQDPAAGQPEVTTSAPALPGVRSIDRARDAAATASERALQHDTIR